MFILKLHDRKGNELKEGDIVKISNGYEFTFFAEVKYIESEGIITPFHTFSFHSFEKVESIPITAIKSKEERYNIWYLYKNETEKDKEFANFEKYLMSWRQCEHHLGQRSWAIVKQASNTKETRIDAISGSLQPFTGEMLSFLLVNALRYLSEEQRASLCFDLYCRNGLTEVIDDKIESIKLGR